MYVVSFCSFVKPFQSELKMFKDSDSVKEYMCKQMNRMCHVMRYEHGNVGEYLIDMGIEYINENFINSRNIANFPCEWFYVCHADYKKTTESSVDSGTFLSEIRFVKQKEKSKLIKGGMNDEYDFSPNGTLFEFKIVRTDLD